MIAETTGGDGVELQVLRTGIDDIRRLGEVNAAFRAAKLTARAEARVHEAALDAVALDTTRFPAHEDVQRWVRDELAAVEGRIEHAVQRAERESAQTLEKLVDRRVEQAGADLERALTERAMQLDARSEQVLKRAEERITAAEERLSRKARRRELKLARVERNRRIATAERRLARRGEAMAVELREQAAEAERRLRALQEELQSDRDGRGATDPEVMARVRSVERQLHAVRD
jgi:exonuclease VII small subunit